MSIDDHVDNLALKSTKITVNSNFQKSTLLGISSKPERKDSNLILLWLGDLYITATYHLLFCVGISQTRHSGRDMISTKCIAKDAL